MRTAASRQSAPARVRRLRKTHGPALSATTHKLGRGLGLGVLLIAVALLAVVAPSASGAGAKLVRDIYPGRADSSPYDLTSVGGRLFFRAWHPDHGGELWRSDGTARGTKLVRDIRPSRREASYPRSGGWMANVGGTLFFGANDGIHGDEMWHSDGTRAGTSLIEDIYPGEESSLYAYDAELANLGGELFFMATDGTHGGLWRSDGTPDGTELVADIGFLSYLTKARGALYFQIQNDDAMDSGELWRSDGTEAGTGLVSDINPGEAGSGPHSLTNVGGTLYFAAYDPLNGSELWQSDGTPEGTELVRDINPGSADSEPHGLTNVGGTLFFGANDGIHGYELWRSDGTTAGTRLVRDISPGRSDGNPAAFANPVAIGRTLFFTAFTRRYDWELWRSDGTRAGTKLVRDIKPEGRREGLEPEELTKVGRTVFFRANEGTHGLELWRSDGTRAGTKLVRDISPGGDGSAPKHLARVRGSLFFMADDSTHGWELWKAAP